uniref:Protein jagged-1 n=1 Tax=Globodera pallida TaxID=36090 RepID=A0A183C8D8_GLOPA
MTLALPTLLFFTFAGIAFIQLFMGLTVEAVSCNLEGVCSDSSGTGEGTECSNCKSCTFKNCCNKVYTSPYAKCNIEGWKASDYKGNVPVDITVPSRKRDAEQSLVTVPDHPFIF